jgi:DNA-binding CsgD family transcriptional regulator
MTPNGSHPANSLLRHEEPELSAANFRELVLERLSSATTAFGGRAILVLEDLHWADFSTRGLVDFLINNRAKAGVSLLLTERGGSEGETEMTPLTRAVGGAGGLVEWLRPLDVVATRKLLSARAGYEVSESFTRSVFTRAEGNPFFTEVLQDEATSGQAIPHRNVVLYEHIGRLERQTRRMLDVLAVIGRRAPFGMLAALGPPALTACIDEAKEKGLVTEDGGYWFRHDLVHEAVVETMPPTTKIRLHRAVARVMEERPRLTGDSAESLILRKAHHWHNAGHHEKAIIHAVEAASLISRTHPEEALELYIRAEHVYLRSFRWPCEKPTRVGFVLEAAETAFRAGHASYACTLMRKALSEPPDPNIPSALLLERLGRFLYEGGDASSYGYLEDAHTSLTPDEVPAIRAQVLSSLGLARVQAGSSPGDLLDEAERIVEEGTEPVEGLASVLVDLAHAHLAVGNLRQSIKFAQRARKAGTEAQDPHTVINAYAVEARASYRRTGRLRDSIKIRTEGLERAESYGQSKTASLEIRLTLVEDLLEYGDWDRAERLLGDQVISDRGLLNTMDGTLVRLYLSTLQGRPMQNPSHLLEMTRTSDPLYESYFLSIAVSIAAALGELELVEELTDRIMRAAKLTPSPASCLYLVDGVAASIGAEVRAATSAAKIRELLEEAEKLYRMGRTCIQASVEFTDGVMKVARAQARGVEGGSDTAGWKSAIQIFELTHAHARRAQALLRFARAVLAKERKPIRRKMKMQVALREALRLTEKMGAEPWKEECILLGIQGDIDLLNLSAPKNPLSKAEQEVLGLVAEGRTSKQVADARHVSPRTIAGQLKSAYRKLGVDNRVEALSVYRREGWLL